MDAAIIRPGSTTVQPFAARAPDPAGAVARSELPPEIAVQQGDESAAPRDRDDRGDDGRRRSIERDAATGVTVMQFVEESSGEVVDQIPAESYLRLKVALRTVLASPDRMSAMIPLDA